MVARARRRRRGLIARAYARSELPRIGPTAAPAYRHASSCCSPAVTQFLALMSAVHVSAVSTSMCWALRIRATTPPRLLFQFLIAFGLLLAVSPRARRRLARAAAIAGRILASHATVLAIWLSLGPAPNAGETPVSGFGLICVALRLRSRLQRRARARALRDDRWIVPRGAGRVWRRFVDPLILQCSFVICAVLVG